MNDVHLVGENAAACDRRRMTMRGMAGSGRSADWLPRRIVRRNTHNTPKTRDTTPRTTPRSTPRTPRTRSPGSWSCSVGETARHRRAGSGRAPCGCANQTPARQPYAWSQEGFSSLHHHPCHQRRRKQVPRLEYAACHGITHEADHLPDDAPPGTVCLSPSSTAAAPQGEPPSVMLRYITLHDATRRCCSPAPPGKMHGPNHEQSLLASPPPLGRVATVTREANSSDPAPTEPVRQAVEAPPAQPNPSPTPAGRHRGRWCSGAAGWLPRQLSERRVRRAWNRNGNGPPTESP
ncbi:hypothetical protein MRB53_041549 [Persea americana]|nr:hypothetical protein MRB53_041549 [Persea americana]